MSEVVPYIGTWIETKHPSTNRHSYQVVPYIGTWIETNLDIIWGTYDKVVPYIGTWIETNLAHTLELEMKSYLI